MGHRDCSGREVMDAYRVILEAAPMNRYHAMVRHPYEVGAKRTVRDAEPGMRLILNPAAPIAKDTVRYQHLTLVDNAGLHEDEIVDRQGASRWHQKAAWTPCSAAEDHIASDATMEACRDGDMLVAGQPDGDRHRAALKSNLTAL
jgi:hypothetical protein